MSLCRIVLTGIVVCWWESGCVGWAEKCLYQVAYIYCEGTSSRFCNCCSQRCAPFFSPLMLFAPWERGEWWEFVEKSNGLNV